MTMDPITSFSGENDSVSCFLCLLFYTSIVAMISFWVGSYFQSPNSSTDSCRFAEPSIFQLRRHLTFMSMSEFIRRRVKAHEKKIQQQSISIFTEEVINSSTRIDLQINVFIDAILSCYISSWYSRISGENTFPQQIKQVLQIAMNRLKNKFHKVDRTSLAKEAIQIIHCHWKEYCSAMDRNLNPSESAVKHFKFSHDFITDPGQLSKQYEFLINNLLNDVLTQQLNCEIFRQFLSGILVKSFLMYYTNLASEPRTVNKLLIALISTGSFDTPNDSESISNTQPSTPSCFNTSEYIITASNCNDNTNIPELKDSPPSGSAYKGNNESQCSSNTENPNLTACKSPTQIFNVTTPEGSTMSGDGMNYLGLKSPGLQGNQKAGSTSNVACVSAALGEIISSAALPLLPEGYRYCGAFDTEHCGGHSTSSLSGAQPELSPLIPASPKEVKFLYHELNDPVEMKSASLPGLPNTQTELTTQTQKIRHYSLNDCDKVKMAESNISPESSAKSFEELSKSLVEKIQDDVEENCPPNSANLTAAETEATRLCKESEDFATTIAKLRNLLEQRESQTNLIESANDSNRSNTDNDEAGTTLDSSESKPPRVPVCKMKSSPQMWTPDLGSVPPDTFSHSLESEKLNRMVDDPEESETEVNCFFLNVAIAKTESCGDSSTQSALYCIQYEGVYLEPEADSETQKFVLRTTIVKRSFKDFVTLQNQLEGNPIWKPHMKGMKTPKKWLHLSFTNQNVVAQRRTHLESYLQQLCYHPVLGFCKELRQFMAYGEDGFLFVNQPSDLVTSRKFDKLAKAFGSYFNTLKDAVPHFESEFPSTPHTSDSPSKSPTNAKKKRMIPSFLNFDKYSSDRVKEPKTTPKVELPSAELKDEELSYGLDTSGSENEKSPSFPMFQNLASDLAHEGDEDAVDQIYPLATTLTQFLCDILWLPNHKPHSASVSAFMSISGKSLENYLQESMDLFLCEDAFLGYLEVLTNCMQEWSQQAENNSPRLDKEFEPEFSKLDLQNTLKLKIPVWIRWMWGRSRSEETIDRLAGFFQSPDINNDLILSILELVFLKLIDASESK